MEARVAGRAVSRLWISRFTIRVGSAAVRMDGIGGVGTDEEHRLKGLSRSVMEAAVEQMRAGDAALSMLYGIRDFYPKFGFVTAGPEHLLILMNLSRDSLVPPGWSVRPFSPDDLERVAAIYGGATSRAVGPAIRGQRGRVWDLLTGADDENEQDECRVVVGQDGVVHGYLWRARWAWYVEHLLEPEFPDALVLGEVMADGPRSADAVLAAARQWGMERTGDNGFERVVLAMPPEGPLGAAAARQDARFVQSYGACGGSMARVLNVSRLLESLVPELRARLHLSACEPRGTLTIRTEIGAATLHIQGDDFLVREMDSESGTSIELPQGELARLALGAFPPEDVLARLPYPPEAEAVRLVTALFPLRHPHMYLPDRF